MEALEAAVAVELFHAFTLVHDDIMDRSLLRRGQPTVHHAWGEPLAILAGMCCWGSAIGCWSAIGSIPALAS
jgi:geranylgeranyl pyrophosphate synthase